MSRPRAATSVAMSTGILPLLNCPSCHSRSCCDLSPWMVPHAYPASHSPASTLSHTYFLLQKMMVRLPSVWCSFMSAASLSYLSPWWMTATCCFTSLLATSWSWRPTFTRTGLFRMEAATRCTFLGHVAVKNSVWRSGFMSDTTFLMSFSNPMSHMRSASSSTSTCVPSRLITPLPSWHTKLSMSCRRPGVAMMISGRPWCRSRIWGPLGAPPYTATLRMPRLRPSLVACSWICTASSRVGAMTRAWHPLCVPRCGCLAAPAGRLARMRIMAGTR
mmetsp:Transcript_7252/g.17938  ORF Transcript_7252/g.17938 Transcript_7252/m.17938 type:complete len:275 (-) Transcript_7252:511-1335(-)